MFTLTPFVGNLEPPSLLVDTRLLSGDVENEDVSARVGGQTTEMQGGPEAWWP